MRLNPKIQCGFTLVEMIIVIVITGIIAGIVAIFIRAPVQGYVDSARRAEMTDIANTALLRIARDLHTAVPNSVRMPAPAGSTYLEFLPTKDGGRYRVNAIGGAGGCGAAGDDLDFTAADTCFEVVGSTISFAVGDAIVIGSTQSDGSQPYLATGAASSVQATFASSGVVGTTEFVKINAKKFPASSELDGRRFEVVDGAQQAVTYACLNLGTAANGDGTGTLTRYWAYGINATQGVPPLGGLHAILADKVSACNFVYNTSNARNSLVAVSLTITSGGESVTLYHEIHMNNIP